MLTQATHYISHNPNLAKNKDKSNRNLLYWFGDVLVVFGLISWIFALNSDFTNDMLDFLYAGNLVLIDEARISAQFLLGLSSIMMVVWGIMIMGLSKQYTKQTRKYLLSAVLVWFVLDTATSIIFGFYLNVPINTLFLAGAIIFSYTTQVLDPSSNLNNDNPLEEL